MLVITRNVLADAPAPAPLIASCNSDRPFKTTPHCPDAFLALFASLSRSLGCTPGLHLLVRLHGYVWQIKCPTAGVVCTIRVVRVRV